MKLEITIFDASGKVAMHAVEDATTVSSGDIEEMIKLIEGGTPAYIAASMVLPSKTNVCPCGAGEGACPGPDGKPACAH